MLLLDYKCWGSAKFFESNLGSGRLFEVILRSVTLQRLKNTRLEDGHKWDTRGRTDRARSDVIRRNSYLWKLEGGQVR